MTAWKTLWTQWECEHCGVPLIRNPRNLTESRREGQRHAKRTGHTVRLVKLLYAEL